MAEFQNTIPRHTKETSVPLTAVTGLPNSETLDSNVKKNVQGPFGSHPLDLGTVPKGKDGTYEGIDRNYSQEPRSHAGKRRPS